jgi:hypothetical protein
MDTYNDIQDVSFSEYMMFRNEWYDHSLHYLIKWNSFRQVIWVLTSGQK